MKQKSHALLGQYLAQQYLDQASRLHTRAFLLGCTQPDKNPATYLKGSLRRQWLRGHNYGNAQRYMQRLCTRLEKKEHLGLFSCYSLGKLIHYTADAFTYAHNAEFSEKLKDHNHYEQSLQAYFLNHFDDFSEMSTPASGSAMDIIRRLHREYIGLPVDIRTDSRYITAVCCCVLCMLLPS